MDEKLAFISLIMRDGLICAIPGEVSDDIVVHSVLENVFYMESFSLASLVAERLNNTFAAAEILLCE